MRPCLEWFWREVGAVAALALAVEYGAHDLMEQFGCRVETFERPVRDLHGFPAHLVWAFA